MPNSTDDWSARSKELAALLARAGLGDRRAFATLYDRTSAQLFAVVLRVQRDRTLAEDVLQEVYVNVWRAARGFDAAQSQPLTWLTSIARNRAIDSLRRASAQPALVTPRDDADDGEGGSADAYAEVPDEADGPLALLERAGEARRVGECMQRLSPSQRQSVALAFYDGLTHQEVAERMRQPLGTVKSWVRRALQTLRGCLDRAVERDTAEGAV
jgi:RNA polymerase sigma factor (sigma-70 family)